MKDAAALWCKWMAAMGWQVAMLSVVILGVSWLVRNRSPRLRYALWSLVLLKVCLPPSLSFFTGAVNWLPRKQMKVLAEIPYPESLSSPHTRPTRYGAEPMRVEVEWTAEKEGVGRREMGVSALASAAMAGSERRENRGYLKIALFAVWAAGVLALAGVVAVRRRRVAILLREARRVDSPLLRETARLLGLRRVKLLSCEKGISSPATFGLVSPRILMPSNLLTDLSEAELRPVLLHELCHIRRGDLWGNFLQTVLQVVYWFHPFVWLANARLRREREMVVDDGVLLRIGEAPQSYGEALTRVVRSASRFPQMAMGLVGIVERPSALAARLARVSNAAYRPTKRISPVSVLLVIAIGALAIPQARTSPEAKKKPTEDRVELSRTAEDLAEELNSEEGGEVEGEHRAEREEIGDEERDREVEFSQELPDTELIPAEMEELSRDISDLRREMAEIRVLVRRVLGD